MLHLYFRYNIHYVTFINGKSRKGLNEHIRFVFRNYFVHDSLGNTLYISRFFFSKNRYMHLCMIMKRTNPINCNIYIYIYIYNTKNTVALVDWHCLWPLSIMVPDKCITDGSKWSRCCIAWIAVFAFWNDLYIYIYIYISCMHYCTHTSVCKPTVMPTILWIQLLYTHTELFLRSAFVLA